MDATLSPHPVSWLRVVLAIHSRFGSYEVLSGFSMTFGDIWNFNLDLCTSQSQGIIDLRFDLLEWFGLLEWIDVLNFDLESCTSYDQDFKSYVFRFKTFVRTHFYTYFCNKSESYVLQCFSTFQFTSCLCSQMEGKVDPVTVWKITRNVTYKQRSRRLNNEQEHVSVKKNEQRRTKRRKSIQTVDMSTQYGEW